MSGRAGAVTVVAIAGPPGAGKSRLTLALAERLPASTWTSIDGFPTPSAMAPGSLERWLDEGADFGRLEVPGLTEALTELKAGRAAKETLTGRPLSPAPLLLVEMPLGRAHRPTADLIDALVWIETPLDVALARNLVAWAKEAEAPPADWLVGYGEHYLAVTRRVLLAQRDGIAADADVVVDGLLAPDKQAARVIAALGLTP